MLTLAPNYALERMLVSVSGMPVRRRCPCVATRAAQRVVVRQDSDAGSTLQT